ncbi:caspase family protein [Kitasatospora sp. NPDC086801]|uniref:caspase family protein n=1 Tax=Kitasatospora sp. NPDC086801 TaxID=3364066 RepID=UPI0038255934
MEPTGAVGREPRRFLIATAVAHHRRSPGGDRPGLVQARQKIIDLFTGRLGYTHVSDLGLDPDRDTLLEHLDRFATDPDRRPDDIVAVYLAGHGQLLGSTPRRHVFFPADADLDKPKLALPTAQIATTLTDDTKITQLLLILDSCHAGQGAGDAVGAALESLRRDIDDDPSGIAVIASAQPAQEAIEGAFPDLLAAAVESRALAGSRPHTLDLGALVAHMNADPAKPPTQRIEWDAARLGGVVPDFFPNPRHRTGPRDLDLAIQHAVEWDAEEKRRETEFSRRMLVRAMASYGGETRWWFAGRRRAVAEIARWLAKPVPGSPALVVSAGPGSGKTAVLGLTAALTHPDHRATVPLHALGLAASDDVPEPGSVDVTLYAQSLTNEAVLRGLAAAARTTARTPGDLVDALGGRTRPFTAIIDALDEAVTPDTLLTQLIRPLLEHGQGRLRLLLGTRPHLLRHLPPEVRVIGLDGPDHRDPDAMAGYVLRGLLESHPESPYRFLAPRRTARVAAVVAAAADPSFLVARIVAGTLAAEPGPADPDDPVWCAALPRTADAAMAQDLDRRLGADAARARDLLRPLAYAEGQGLPWEDVWAPLASGVAGRPFTNADLFWLKRHTGSYVVEATEDGRSAYRLYHMALDEHLRRGVDERSVQHAFVDALLGTVPRAMTGERDWARAHPYILRHLATHAARAGRIDELLDDLGYVAVAAPGPLSRALDAVTTAWGRRIASVYRISVGRHGALSAADRRLLLALDALRNQDAELAAKLAGNHPWRLRWATGSQVSPALRATLGGHTGWIFGVACTVLDGVPVAVTASGDATLRVWDLVANRELRTLLGHRGVVDAVACAVVDGRPLAVSGARDGTARVWDLRTGEQLAVLRGHEVGAGSRDALVMAVAFASVDGETVVITGGTDGTVRLWDWPAATTRCVIAAHGGFVQSLACHVVDGVPVVVSGGRDPQVRVWDLRSGSERTAFDIGHHWVDDLVSTVVDGVPMVVASVGRVLRMWDLTGGGRHREVAVEDETGGTTALAVTEVGGSVVAVCGESGGTTSLRSLTGSAEPCRLTGHTNILYAVACTEIAGEPVAVTGGYDGEVRVWDLPRAVPRREHTGHTGSVFSVALAVRNGRQLVATGGMDGNAWVRDLATGEVVAVLTANRPRSGLAYCLTVDGELLVSIPDRVPAGARVVDPFTGATVAQVKTDDLNARALGGLSLDGRSALLAEADRTLRVYDLAAAVELASFDGRSAFQRSAFSTRIRGGQIVVLAGEIDVEKAVETNYWGEPACGLFVWHPATGAVRHCTGDATRSVTALALAESADGPFAVYGTSSGEVGVWDLVADEERVVFTAHADEVSVLACQVVDGAMRVATAARDGFVRLWDVASRAELGHWPLPYPVQELAMARDGAIVVATGHEVIVLDPAPGLSLRRPGRGRGR